MHVNGSIKPFKSVTFSVPRSLDPPKSVLTQWIVLPAKQEPGVIVSEVTSIAFALNDLNG